MREIEPRFETLTAALTDASAARQGYIFLDQKKPVNLSFAELLTKAKRVAGKLQASGVDPGDRLILILPTSPAFAVTFWGAVLVGAVPCILPSPALSRAIPAGIKRVEAVQSKIKARCLITTEKELSVWGNGFDQSAVMTVEALEREPFSAYTAVSRRPDDLALIQATSGSTGSPKCVPLTHQNLLINIAQIGERLETMSDDVVVCWLPMFHDMGLIGCFLHGACWGLKTILMPPSKFIRRPVTWLKAISDYRGTQSPAPNFAYGLLLNKVKAEDIPTFDLSSWRSAICGAEPIDSHLLEAVVEKFSKSHLNPLAMAPAYGLAEAALCVSIYAPSEPLRYEVIDSSLLHENRSAIPIRSDFDGPTVAVCNCGRPVSGTSVEVRNERCERLVDGMVGRIWISGPSVMGGYLNAEQKTAEILLNGWLDTGDVGYMRDGSLFVLGRDKELIMIRGQNYYPIDFERAAEEVDGVTAGRVAAFGLYDASIYSETLMLVIEVRASQLNSDLSERVKAHIARQTGVPPAAVYLASRGTIPRTTSGKLQRTLLKRRWVNGGMR
ncbi:MAG: AMP-binding protein [Chloroflexota bacterium]